MLDRTMMVWQFMHKYINLLNTGLEETIMSNHIYQYDLYYNDKGEEVLSQDRLMNLYAGGKIAGSLAYHAGLAALTNGVSLLATLPLSVIAHANRQPDLAEALLDQNFGGRENGNVMEAERAADAVAAHSRQYNSALFRGALQSVWQAASRPVAYCGMALGALADGVGHVGKFVSAAAIPNNQSFANKTDCELPMRWKNTVRDFFTRAGSIAPNEVEMNEIQHGSLLVSDDQRPNYGYGWTGPTW